MRTPILRTARARRSGAAVTAAVAGLLVLAGCGSGSDAGDSAATGGDGSGTTVSVRDVGSTTVLATSSGQTLYSSSQEKGRVLCTSDACEAIWVPLTVPDGQDPTGAGAVGDELTTLERQDGSLQVAFDGRPLYTFSLDHGPGQVNGDGQRDSFDGTDFTWHAATPDGVASATGGPGGPGYAS